MAKATITFQDEPDGITSVRIEFDPPLARDEDGDDFNPTSAQTTAFRLFEIARPKSAELDYDVDDFEDDEDLEDEED